MAFAVLRFIQNSGSFVNYYMVIINISFAVLQIFLITFKLDQFSDFSALNVFVWLQYHGGTNFERTSGGPFIATSYDYDAPLDEYGMLPSCTFACLRIYQPLLSDFPCSFLGLPREPKWGHMRDLHKAIKLCEPALVSVDPTVTWLGKNQEVRSLS